MKAANETMQRDQSMDAAVDGLLREVMGPGEVVSETALRQLRPLLEEIVRYREAVTRIRAWLTELGPHEA